MHFPDVTMLACPISPSPIPNSIFANVLDTPNTIMCRHLSTHSLPPLIVADGDDFLIYVSVTPRESNTAIGSTKLNLHVLLCACIIPMQTRKLRHSHAIYGNRVDSPDSKSMLSTRKLSHLHYRLTRPISTLRLYAEVGSSFDGKWAA